MRAHLDVESKYGLVTEGMGVVAMDVVIDCLRVNVYPSGCSHRNIGAFGACLLNRK